MQTVSSDPLVTAAAERLAALRQRHGEALEALQAVGTGQADGDADLIDTLLGDAALGGKQLASRIASRASRQEVARQTVALLERSIVEAEAALATARRQAAAEIVARERPTYLATVQLVVDAFERAEAAYAGLLSLGAEIRQACKPEECRLVEVALSPFQAGQLHELVKDYGTRGRKHLERESHR